MFSIITAFFNSLSNGFSFAQTTKENQVETDLLSDDNKKNKALKIANEVFKIVQDSNGYISDRDMKLIDRMRKKFDDFIIN